MSEEKRRELAQFLKRCRERLKPEDVGLVPDRRRRTPGLRREEVAGAARVSPEWYTWLEQARPIRASEATLRRIAVALRLAPSETRQLLFLSGYDPEDPNGPPDERVSPGILRFLDRLADAPAYVLGARWDFLAWNAASALLYGDLGAIEKADRNCVVQTFLGAFRDRIEDWERHARAVVAGFRAAYAPHAGDIWFEDLISRLASDSPDFARLWTAADAPEANAGDRRFRMPDGSLLTFEHSAFDLADEVSRGLRLVTYVPVRGPRAV